MRLVELRPAFALCVVLASAVPAAAVISFETTEEDGAVDSVANPQAITLADVDGDNIDDVIVVENGDVVTVFGNDGTGALDAGESYDTIGEGPVAVATGQFNADNFIDIVTANAISGTVSVLLNNDQGFFDDADPRQFLVGANPVGIAVGDFNNDTEPDLAVLSPTLIYFLQGNGDGTFSAFNPATIPTRGNDSIAIAAGLLDSGNTNVDLAVSNRGSGTVSIFLGNGDGTFTFNGTALPGTAPAGFVIADADGDQSNDLIVADTQGLTTTEMSLMRNDGEAVFSAADKFTGPEEPFAITALDVEPDGKVDLAITSMANPGEIFLLCQPSDECVDTFGGSLEAGVWRSAIGGTVPGCADTGQVAIAAGKLDGDDKDDIVALKGEDGDFSSLCIALNRSRVGGVTPVPTTPTGPSPTPSGPTPTPTLTRTFTPTPTSTEIPTIGVGVCNTKNETGFPSLGRPVALTTEDFNRDGIRDVAVADSTGNRIVIVLTGLGAPNPSDPCMTLNLQSGAQLSVSGPEAVVAADLDRDGKADLAVIGVAGLSVFYGDGSGGFSPSAANPISAGADPADVVIADFNRDFTPDLVVPDLGSQNASIFIGTRQRNQPFTGPCAMPVGRGTNAAISTDLNSDGRNDFAVTGPQTRDVGVFLQVANAPLNCGDMAGSFQGQTPLSLPSEPIGLVAGAFALNDTIPDLVVAMKQADANGTVLLFEGRVAGDGVTYQRGTTTALPTPTPPTSATFSLPSAIGSGDVERDGRSDLLLTDMRNNTLVEFRGQASGGLGVPLIPLDVEGTGPTALAVVDLDRDGRDDVVVADADDGSLSYMLSALRAATPTPIPTNTPTITTTPPPPPGTPTSTPTITPTPTRSRRPSSTPTPVPTNTQRGVVTLSGGGCAIDEGSSDSGPLFVAGFALAVILMRRRLVDHLPG